MKKAKRNHVEKNQKEKINHLKTFKEMGSVWSKNALNSHLPFGVSKEQITKFFQENKVE